MVATTYPTPSAARPTTIEGSACQAVQSKPPGPRGGGPAGPATTCAISPGGGSGQENEGAEQGHQGQDDRDRDDERTDEQRPHDVAVVPEMHEEADHQEEL